MIGQMSDIIVGYKDHPTVRLYQDFTDPTIAHVHAAPSSGLVLQNTTNEVADEIAVANQDLVLVLATSALKVPVEGFFGLFSALRNLLSRDLSEGFDIYWYGGYTRVAFPQSPRPVQRNVGKCLGDDLCRFGCPSHGAAMDCADREGTQPLGGQFGLLDSDRSQTAP